MSCFAQLGPTQGLGRCKAPPPGSPGATFALLLVWDTGRDECGWGSRRSPPAAGGDAQPWQEQVVDAPTAPRLTSTLEPCARADPPLQCSQQPRSAGTACGQRSPPRVNGRSSVVTCAAGGWAQKGRPHPMVPHERDGAGIKPSVLSAFSTPFSGAQPGTSQGGTTSGPRPTSSSSDTAEAAAGDHGTDGREGGREVVEAECPVPASDLSSSSTSE